jgi:Cdc6-like AAA superfamily ATPase
MFRSYDHHQAENILIARVTQLTTDPYATATSVQMEASVTEIMDTLRL